MKSRVPAVRPRYSVTQVRSIRSKVSSPTFSQCEQHQRRTITYRITLKSVASVGSAGAPSSCRHWSCCS